MFITTPILCYWLGVHDCMLAVTGSLASIAMNVTFVNKAFYLFFLKVFKLGKEFDL
jgi:hypothetical protein